MSAAPDVRVKIAKWMPSGTSDCQLVDDFLAGALGATIFHTTEWNQIVSESFGTQLTYLIARQGPDIVGVMPCHLVFANRFTAICYSPPRLYEVPYGGPVAVGAQGVDICWRLVRAASRLASSTEVDLFTSPGGSNWLKAESPTRNDTLETAYVNLDHGLDEIWLGSISSKRRNMIRKAQKSGVQIEVRDSGAADIYGELVEGLVKRSGLRERPVAYYSRVLSTFGPRDQARLYLAFHNGEILAGGIFLRWGKACYYWHGASASEKPSLGQGELIQWEVINWAKRSGCHFYDLVGVERDRLPHIALFKLGFTNDIQVFHHLSLISAKSRFIRRLARLTGTTAGN